MTTARNIRNHATVVGVFNDVRMAQAAVEELRRVGFREDQIGVVSRDHRIEGGTTATEETAGSHWEEGAAVGIAAGAGIGALWAVGMATIALPPILPAVLVSSWLASVLASAASRRRHRRPRRRPDRPGHPGGRGDLLRRRIPFRPHPCHRAGPRSLRRSPRNPAATAPTTTPTAKWTASPGFRRSVNVPVASKDVVEARRVSQAPDVRTK